MKNIVTNGFKNYKVPALITKAKYIVSEMGSDDEDFPVPDPTLAYVQTVIDDLESANLVAQSGAKADVALLAVAKNNMVNTLQLEGIYVNLRSDGDRSIAAQSGFDLRKLPQPRIIKKPDTPVVKRGSTLGDLAAKTPHQKEADGFNWYKSGDATKPLAEWELFDGETAQIVFTGCTPGETCYICVEVLGARKQREISPIATVVA
jgi:hypothetical protein